MDVKIQPKEAGEIQVKERDITLHMIEEFQASEVEHYTRAFIKLQDKTKDDEKFRAIVMELCAVSQEIVTIFRKRFQRATLSTKELEKGGKVMQFFDSEMTRRKASPLKSIFEEGRKVIKSIDKAMYDVERAGPRASPDSFKQIITEAEQLETKFKEQFSEKKEAAGPGLSGMFSDIHKSFAPGMMARAVAEAGASNTAETPNAGTRNPGTSNQGNP